MALKDDIIAVRRQLSQAGIPLGKRPALPQLPRKIKTDNSTLAAAIDHTLLKPDAGRADVERICQEANAHGFASVCVNPLWVSLVASLVEGPATCTVAGFPLGASTTEVKASEALRAVKDGATEVDMVLSVGQLCEAFPVRGDVDGEKAGAVRDDVAAVVDAVRSGKGGGQRIVKVILETGLLSRRQKIGGCLLVAAAGADFVKTSTGFGGGGATSDDVRLMRSTVGWRLGVKASGGVRTGKQALSLLRAGADRLGCSGSIALLKDD